MSRLVEITKDGNNYVVNPKASSGPQSLMEITVEGCDASYGPAIFMDSNYVPIHIDDVRTKSDWSDVYYIVHHSEYSDHFLARVDAPIPEKYNNVNRFNNVSWDDNADRLDVTGPGVEDNIYVNTFDTQAVPLLIAMLGRYYG